MKRFLQILLSFAIIAGGLYGARAALEFFDATRAGYREELARSQLLNLDAQRRISELMEENSRLRRKTAELEIENGELKIEEEN